MMLCSRFKTVTRFSVLMMAVGMLFSVVQAATPVKKVPPSPAGKVAVNLPNIVMVTPKELISNPKVYQKKNVQLQGVVSGFSALGLDYPRVKFPAKDYVTLVIYRQDVPEQFKIPLTELKLFLKRDVIKDIKRLGQGDTISLQGTVVSDALGDAWVDVAKITVLKSVQKEDTSGEAGADSIQQGE
jgi:hypothetical protein